ncbi:MAG: hypothetical protein ACTSWP_01740 [Candidatus Freyarchaeota archaeon]
MDFSSVYAYSRFHLRYALCLLNSVPPSFHGQFYTLAGVADGGKLAAAPPAGCEPLPVGSLLDVAPSIW